MYLYDFATFGFLDEGLVVEHVDSGGDCSALSNPTLRVCSFRSFLYFGMVKMLAWKRKS